MKDSTSNASNLPSEHGSASWGFSSREGEGAESANATESLGLSPADQQRLSEILDEYLQKIESGHPADPQQLLEQHPQYRDALSRYLESLGVIHYAAQGMHGEAESIRVPTSWTEDRRIGDYQIRRQIGRGGMGIVYEADQISLGRRVALKVLPLAAVLDQKQIARFRREAQAAAQLHHPHIVPVFGVGCEEGIHFYSMQLIDGQSFDRVVGSLRKGGDSTVVMSNALLEEPKEEHAELSADRSSVSNTGSQGVASISDSGSVDRRYVDRIAELVIQAAQALQHAHEYGVIHRDIKPSNLMLDDHGKLWITDFGLAHIQSDADVTATGDLVGTLRYMSPEQASGTSLVDQRTDIYSLGVTLYELLTLQQAIPTRDRAQILRDIELVEPPSMRRVNPAIPRDLETIVLKSITKDRDHRYATAQELADDLQRYLDGKPTLARRPTVLDRGTKWAFRHRTVVSCAVVMLVLALCGTSTSLLLINREKDAAYQQREAAIAALEKITKLSEGLTKEPVRRRQIQRSARESFQEIVNSNQHLGKFVELAEAHHRIGGISEQLGELDAAADSYRLAIATYDELASHDDRHVLGKACSWNNLGQVLSRLGNTNDARDAYQKALAIYRSTDSDQAAVSQGVALVEGNLGHLESQLGHREQAIQYMLSAIRLREIHLQSRPDDVQNQVRLASNYHNLSCLMVAEDHASAKRYCELAISLQQVIAQNRPRELEPRVDLALSFNNMGAICLRNGNAIDAANYFEQATNVGRQLTMEAAEIPQFWHDLAISCNNLGKALAAAGELPAALVAYREASAQFERLLPSFSQDPVTLARYGGTLFNQAVVCSQLPGSKPAEIARLFEEAINAQRASVRLAPQTTQYASLLSLSASKYAQFLRDAGLQQQAGRLHQELTSLVPQETEHANLQ